MCLIMNLNRRASAGMAACWQALFVSESLLARISMVPASRHIFGWLIRYLTRCDDVETRKLRNIDVCSTSRLLDSSLMQINQVSSISRGRKELLQADLVRPPSNDVGCAQKWSASMDVAIVFNRDEQQIAEAMRDSVSAQS
jgi:hypothetical protein